MQFVSALNVHRMVEQLRLGQHISMLWLSEGKVVHEGMVQRIEVKASKGLKITLDSGKIVWWRCNRIAFDVFVSFYYPVAVPFIPLTALINSVSMYLEGYYEFAYSDVADYRTDGIVSTLTHVAFI